MSGLDVLCGEMEEGDEEEEEEGEGQEWGQRMEEGDEEEDGGRGSGIMSSESTGEVGSTPMFGPLRNVLSRLSKDIKDADTAPAGTALPL